MGRYKGIAIRYLRFLLSTLAVLTNRRIADHIRKVVDIEDVEEVK